MILETMNSVYEIDEGNIRIRRIRGRSCPTRHFRPDGEWKVYHAVDGFAVNDYPVVAWPDGKYTTLSRVVEIHSTLEDLCAA